MWNQSKILLYEKKSVCLYYSSNAAFGQKTVKNGTIYKEHPPMRLLQYNPGG